MNAPTHAYQRKCNLNRPDEWVTEATGSFDYCKGWDDANTPRNGPGRVVALFDWERGHAHAFWRTQGEAGFWNPCEVEGCLGFGLVNCELCPEKTVEEVNKRILREPPPPPRVGRCPACKEMVFVGLHLCVASILQQREAETNDE